MTVMFLAYIYFLRLLSQPDDASIAEVKNLDICMNRFILSSSF